jgi:hypothetical protein
MNKAILLVIIQLFLTQVFAQGQIGGITRDDPTPTEDPKPTNENEPSSIEVSTAVAEFAKLEELSSKFIRKIESRYLKCNKIKIGIKDLSDLYVQLAGQNLKLISGESYQSHELLHCKGTEISNKDKVYSCLIKGSPKKLLKQMLSNKLFPKYLKLKMHLKDSEVKETIRFFESLL